MTEKILTIAFLLSLFYLPLRSQDRQIFFENLREKEGLPYHIVKGIDQDSFGRLWVPTYNGLYRYDGYQFKPYQHSPKDTNTISSNLCRAVLIDHAQQIWVGTETEGISVLDAATNKVRRFYPSTFIESVNQQSFRIEHIVEDINQNIWIASSQGIFRVKLDQGNLTHLEIPILPDSFSSKKTTSLYADSLGKVWFGTNKGLFVFDTSQNEWLKSKQKYTILNQKIGDIIENKDGTIWLGVRDKIGIYTITKGTIEPKEYPYVSNLEKAGRVQLTIDFQNHLWVGAGRSGVFRHNLTTKENLFFEGKDYDQKKGNFSNFTHSPFTDKFGNVWFCGGGLHKWSNTYKNFTHYTHPFNDYQTTAAIYDDEKFRISSLWGQGIVVWNKKKNKFFRLNQENGLFSDRIYAFVHHKANTYVFGGQGGYQLVDLEKMIIGKQVPLKGTIYHGIKEERKITIGGSRGIWEIENENIRQILKGVSLRYFQKTKDEKFWIPSLSKGLYCWDQLSDSLLNYRHQKNQTNRLQSNRVEHLDISKDGTIWLATGAGVESYNLKTKKWNHYNEDSQVAGIRANAIHSIGDSAIWLSNNQGIARLLLKDQNWTYFNTEDGILNTYFYERCSYKNKEGRLFFGGRLGIVHFLPGELKKNPIPPNLFFDEIKVYNQILSPLKSNRKRLELDWNHRFFEVNFTGLQLSEPSSVSYQYRFLPVQAEWTEIAKQPLFFSGISPGNYKLEIKAQNGDGIPSVKTLSLDILVDLPFWKKPWFLILLGSLIAFLIFFYFQKTKEKYQQKIALEKKINEIERTALKAQMNPHFIFNAMSSIQHFIMEADEENALKYMSKLSRIIRRVLDNSNKNFIPFHQEISLLNDYVLLEKLRFDQDFKFEISMSNTLDSEVIAIPPLLIQPLIENAINHGLRPSKREEKILHLKFTKNDSQTLFVEVQDNGVGRKQSSKSKDKNHKSNGTQNIKSRLQLIGDQLDVLTQFEIVDLYDEQGKSAGTKVNLLIPYK